MISRISLQPFKVVFLAQGIFALLLTTTDKASAIDIKDTKYPIPSGAYFVSANGSSSNSGRSPSSPWPVAKALSSAPSGATIVFRGGTYRNIETTIRKRLTLQAYPHEKAWLKGSVVVAGWVANGNAWRKDGWAPSFPQDVSRQTLDPAYPMAGYRDMVYVNGVSLRQVASKSRVVPGTFYVDSANKRLYIGNNPAGKTVEATAHKQALSDWGGNSSVIRGLGFAHYADRGVTIWAPHVTLENNTFAWNGAQGAKLYGSDAVVRGNTFSYNARVGLWMGAGSTRAVIEGNTISYNNVEHFAVNWDAAGVKAISTKDFIWRNNIVEHNFATGMWVDASSSNTTIVHNTVRYNDAMGIFFEVSNKAIIAANLAYKNRYSGIMVSNASNAKVYNNTLVDNKVNLQLKDTTRNNTNSAEIAAGITWIARNNVFKNNILSNARGNVLFELSNCSTREASARTVSGLDYNAYYRASSSQPRDEILWSLGGGKCAVNYPSVAAFNSASNYEDHALVIDNASTNPFFVDTSRENYSLKSGSPAIRRGQPLPTDVARAIGVSSGVSIDLGAFQSRIY